MTRKAIVELDQPGTQGFEFNLELSLVEHWLLELRILLGYALQVRTLPA
jgi:hypothetical protein